MTPREFSIQVVQQLVSAGYLAYWAGGCVRDFLRGKEPHDFDVATNATPEQVRDVFGHRKTLAVGASFGVIIVLGPKSAGQVEVATFRSEGEYTDGRRPDHVSYCSPEEDAQRRDFTINGMFFDPLTDVIHDFVQGKQDLENRIVRAIGDPHARIAEDKLRMLRAVRFTAVMDFELDHTTAEAIRQLASHVQIVSAERIAQELRKMLADVHRSRAMLLAEELGLLQEIIPEVFEHSHGFTNQRGEQLLSILSQLDVCAFTTAMGTLLRDVPCPSLKNHKDVPEQGTVQAVCRRLKLSNEETETIVWLVAHRDSFDSLEAASVATLKRLVVQPNFEALELLERTAAQVEQKSNTPFEHVARFLESTPAEEINPPELLTGKDLIQAGYQPGPQFKEWLYNLRTLQLEGELQKKDQALEWIAQRADSEAQS